MRINKTKYRSNIFIMNFMQQGNQKSLEKKKETTYRSK